MKYIKNIFNGKYFSLLAICCLLFTFLAGARLYIYENIYTAYTLVLIGGIGQYIRISVLVPRLVFIGAVIGIVAGAFTHKMVSKRGLTYLYAFAGMAAVVYLLFTPYNIQLLTPSTHLQTIAFTNFVIAMVFAMILAMAFAYILSVHIIKLVNDLELLDIIMVVAAVIVGLVLALVTVDLKWSFTILVASYGLVLAGINVIYAFFVKDEVKLAITPPECAENTDEGVCVQECADATVECGSAKKGLKALVLADKKKAKIIISGIVLALIVLAFVVALIGMLMVEPVIMSFVKV